jgi:hypothetical protein
VERSVAPVSADVRGPDIEPIPANYGPVPFWSVVIPVYNRSDYLAGALESALSQDAGPEEMHIEVIDDASPDVDFEPIVRQLGRGRVGFYRQPKNLGLIPGWNACLSRSRGRWVHMLHDDDRVLPGFYAAMRRGLEAHPRAASGFCRHAFIDAQGRITHAMPEERATPGLLENWIDRLAVMQRVQFASVVVRRDVYEALGGFRPDMRSAADWEMWKRIAAHYPVLYEPQLLAHFRLHGGSESTRLIREGENIADTLLAIEGARPYLPPERAAQLTAAAKEHYAVSALQEAQAFVARGDAVAAGNQLRQAIRCSPTPRVLALAVGNVMPELEKLPGNAAEVILAEARDRLAEWWLQLPPGDVAAAYAGEAGKLQQYLRARGTRLLHGAHRVATATRAAV